MIHSEGSSMNAPTMTPPEVTQILDSTLGDLPTALLSFYEVFLVGKGIKSSSTKA